jgi:hypothetical protein
MVATIDERELSDGWQLGFNSLEAELASPRELAVEGKLVTEETQADLKKAALAELDTRDVNKPGWRKQRTALRELQRAERLFWRMYPDEDAIRIVVVGVRQSPHGPKVSSIAYHTNMVTDE